MLYKTVKNYFKVQIVYHIYNKTVYKMIKILIQKVYVKAM